MRRLSFIAILSSVISFSTYAQDEAAMQLSLDEAISFALKNNTKIKNAKLDQASTIAMNKEVTGRALPQLSAKGGINYAPLVAGFLVPDFTKAGIRQYVLQDALNNDALQSTPDFLNFALQPKWTSTATAELNQLLFDPGMMVALQARKSLEELADEQLRMTETDLRVEVTKAYYDVLIAEKRLELLDKNVERIGQLESETRKIYEVGFAEKLDVDRITVTLNNLKTQQTNVRQLVQVAYMVLKFRMGMDLEMPVVLTDDLEEENLDAELLSKAFDYQNRLEYKLLDMQGTLLQYDIKRYRLGVLPTLSAFGNYGYTLYNNQTLFDDNNTEKWQKSALVGIQLSVPIFDGFQRRNKRIQADIAYEKNRNDLTNLTQALELEKVNAQIKLRSSLSNLSDQEANMKLAEEVYNVSRTKYKEGVGSSLEVINAETSLKEAQTNYFSAMYETITARIDLLKALGEY